jgi:hypothetical protein
MRSPLLMLLRESAAAGMGDRWSQYCILGLEGETLAEGQLRREPCPESGQ